MNESAQSSAPNFGYSANPPKRILWKWSLAIAAVGLVFLMWQCGSALYSGSKLADQAVQRFHAQLNRGAFDEICREGDEAFSQGEKHDELLHFLEQVHGKLGNVAAGKLVNLHVKAGTSGTFLTAQFTTEFDQGQAAETFTWRKSGSTLKLYGYNVQSSAFLK
jgi:hypothetical protein